MCLDISMKKMKVFLANTLACDRILMNKSELMSRRATWAFRTQCLPGIFWMWLVPLWCNSILYFVIDHTSIILSTASYVYCATDTWSKWWLGPYGAELKSKSEQWHGSTDRALGIVTGFHNRSSINLASQSSHSIKQGMFTLYPDSRFASCLQ